MVSRIKKNFPVEYNLPHKMIGLAFEQKTHLQPSQLWSYLEENTQENILLDLQMDGTQNVKDESIIS